MTMRSGTIAPAEVRSMFDRIAPIYDAMNRVMTGGLDGGWRRLAASAVVRPGDRVLDVCCGTGRHAARLAEGYYDDSWLWFTGPRPLDAACAWAGYC